MLSRSRLSLAALVVAATAGLALAQQVKATRPIPTPLMCDYLEVANGLPIGHVTAFAQDKLGFMWIGTPEGLVRYDGLRMRVYRRNDQDPTSISDGNITALAVDADGKLWIGTADHGINLYDPETDKFTRFEHAELGIPQTESAAVFAITRDKKDRMWFAMAAGGLDRYDAAAKKFVAVQSEPLDVVVSALDVDANGDLWVGTPQDGVIRWNPDTNASTVFGPDKLDIESAVVAVRVASTGKVWLGTEQEGVVVLDPATGKHTLMQHNADDDATIGDDQITQIFEASNKAVWIGTKLGLNRVDPDGTITRYVPDKSRTDKSALHFPEVLAIYQDAAGVLYFGGFTVGACKVVEDKLQFGYHRTRQGSYATSFSEDPDGSLWVASYLDGLYHYDFAKRQETVYFRLTKKADGTEGDFDFTKQPGMFAMHRDKHGILWIAPRTYGLIGFDPKTETYRDYHYNPEVVGGIPYHTFNSIYEDSQGLLWLAAGDGSGGLVRFDPETGEFRAFLASDNIGLTADSYFQIYPDPGDPNVLWLATYGGGLVRFDLGAGAGKAFRAKAGDEATLGSDIVTSIVKAEDGTLWLGTVGGGLNHLDPKTGKVERFNTGNTKGALPNDTIYGLLQDGKGKLWLGTNGGGLVEFDPKKKEFTTYTSNDGAQDEFNQCAFLRTTKGELLFGGPAGWNGFKPQGLTRDTYVPPVVLTSYKLGNQEGKLGRPIWTLPTLEISYSDSFELQFAALAFAAPTRNKFMYKLEGYDSDWIETDRPFAAYQKLGGGSYTLHVRASNRHGVWNEAGVAIKLKVTPPFWRSWYAFIVYVLLLAGIAVAVIRFQRERLRKAEREGRLALVERDLALTGAVQTSFLPEKNEMSTSRMQLVGLYRPADACGGDWWWYERLSGNRHLVMVGDVTGHGAGPAMVTAAVATAFRVLLESGQEDVQGVLEALNREVLRVGKGKYHMTMAALEVDENEGRWIFHSAGGPPILSLNSKGKHRVVFCPGAPLGTETGFEIGRVEGKFKPTERMLLYTDGIPELFLPGGTALGMRRFAQMYEATRAQHLHEAANSIMFQADRSQAGQPQADDWTFAIIEWRDDGTAGFETTMGGSSSASLV